MDKKLNIFLNLRQDHDVQRNLLELLLETSGDSDDRKRIYYNLKNELEIHAKYEERYLYSSLLKFDLTQDKAKHAIAEHKEINDILTEIDNCDMSSSGWLTFAKKLNEKVNHHLAEEEQEFFQLAGKVLTESEKLEFAKKYVKEMSEDSERF